MARQINPAKAAVVLAGVAIGGGLDAYCQHGSDGALGILIAAFFGAVVGKFVWDYIT